MLDLRNNPNNIFYGNYTVAITDTIFPGMADAITPVAIAVNKTVATILWWFLSKKNTWSDIDQVGTFCEIIDRKWCLNHEDFERVSTPFDDVEIYEAEFDNTELCW